MAVHVMANQELLSQYAPVRDACSPVRKFISEQSVFTILMPKVLSRDGKLYDAVFTDDSLEVTGSD